MPNIRVFVWKVNQGQVGNGLYAMMACFQEKKVHVPFTFEAHSENEYLQTVGNPTACDGSCMNYTGHMANFGVERHHSSYEVQQIVDQANSFCDAASD